MREKLAAIDIEAIAIQGHFRLTLESIDKYLALIAEEVRVIKNLYEPVVKVVSGDTLYIDADVNRYDVVENFRQKVLGLLEEK